MVEAPAGSGDDSPISQEEFRSLAEMIGLDMPEVLADLIETYVSESHGLVENLVSAHQANDRNAMVRPAHSLKSSSASIGAMRLSRLCADLEAHLRGAPTSMDVSLQVGTIAEEFTRVVAALEREIEQLLNT